MKSEKHFKRFFEKYITSIENKTDKTRTELLNNSGLSRQILYRWLKPGSFPRPGNVYMFFENTYPKINKNDYDVDTYKKLLQERQDQLQKLFNEAYFSLLLDFHEHKKSTFC